MMDFIDSVNIQSGDVTASKIMVIGVGGGGSNAVRHMFNRGIHNVLFMVCNTDKQALDKNPVPFKMQIGRDLTGGLGAGNRPERGREAALESRDDIRETLEKSGVKMVFVTAGMGGGTGTGAAPVIAEVAKELGILTIAIVTVPFRYEGDKRIRQAVSGIAEMRKHVDSLLIIDNENINRMYGDLTFSEAFGKADDILTNAAKCIAETITNERRVNVDFADVETTMSNSGVAIMGFAVADVDTDNIAATLIEEALMSPLLSYSDISGAQNLLVNISWKDKELTMNAVTAINKHVQAAAGPGANLIWGSGYDDTLEDGKASVVIVATGFADRSSQRDFEVYMGLAQEDPDADNHDVVAAKVASHVGSDGDDKYSAGVQEPRQFIRPFIRQATQPFASASQHAAPEASSDKVVISWDDTPHEDKGKSVGDDDDDGFALIDSLQQVHSAPYRGSSDAGHGSARNFLSLDDEDTPVDSEPDDTMLVVQPHKSSAPEADTGGDIGRSLFSGQQLFEEPQRRADEPTQRRSPEHVSIEDMENIPAYLRRNMLVTPNASAKKRFEKLKLRDDDK